MKKTPKSTELLKMDINERNKIIEEQLSKFSDDYDFIEDKQDYIEHEE